MKHKNLLAGHDMYTEAYAEFLQAYVFLSEGISTAQLAPLVLCNFDTSTEASAPAVLSL